MEKKQALQILRAVAALSVMTRHVTQVSFEHFGTPVSLEICASGVDVFFVISGFVMAASIERTPSPWFFIQSRLARIVPLYWLLTFAVFIVAALAPHALATTVADPVQLVKSLFFIPFKKIDGQIHPMLFQGWTLNAEMFFYLTLGIALAITSRPQLAVSALLFGLVMLGFFDRPHNAVLAVYTSDLFLEFLYGLALYHLTSGGKRIRTGQWLLLPIGIAALIVAFYYLPEVPRCFKEGLPAAMIVTGALGLQNRESRVLAWGETLGDASYSIYLFHTFAVMAVTFAIAKLVGHAHPILGLLALAALSYPITCAVAVLLYQRFEIPAKTFFAPRRPGRPSSGASAEPVAASSNS